MPSSPGSLSITNPLFPGRGVCDPHVRIFDDRAYLYASHDASPENRGFVMNDWWVWQSDDLCNWSHACTIRPEQTYIGAPCDRCWATDAAERDGRFYFYFSEGVEATGVLVGETPTGPWRDPLGHPLISRSDIGGCAHDPGVFIDDDGEAYVVVGAWTYWIARLNPDMISLAEKPRRIEVLNPEGPAGPGVLDDKPYLHKRHGIYYLSWGAYYGMSDSPYGPFECQGSFLQEDQIDPGLRYRGKRIRYDPDSRLAATVEASQRLGRFSTYDRHGSFFTWKGRDFFICNEHSQSGNVYFRDCCLGEIHYRPDGTILPMRLALLGI